MGEEGEREERREREGEEGGEPSPGTHRTETTGSGFANDASSCPSAQGRVRCERRTGVRVGEKERGREREGKDEWREAWWRG